MIIKICGMRDPLTIRGVAELPVDAMGFIFHPSSPRYVGDDDGLADSLQQILPRTMVRIGVFVDATIEEILDRTRAFRLDGIQLHGRESAEDLARLQQAFQETGMRQPFLIKAFSIVSTDAFPDTDAYEPWCRYFLFDTGGNAPGGNGVPFAWERLQDYHGTTPFLLAGGIGPEDISKLAALTHPQWVGIDLNSRFENQPGVKDPDRLARFLIQLETSPCTI